MHSISGHDFFSVGAHLFIFCQEKLIESAFCIGIILWIPFIAACGDVGAVFKFCGKAEAAAVENVLIAFVEAVPL